MNTTFEQGWAARPFKEQFPQLTDHQANNLDKVNEAITTLLMSDMLTDSAYKMLREKKFPKLVASELNLAAFKS